MSTDAAINQNPVITPFQFYKKAFWQFPVLMSTMLIMEILQAALMVMIPFAVHNIVSAAEVYSPENGPLWEVIKTPFFWLVGVTVAITIFSRCSGVALVFTAVKIRRQPRLWLFEHLSNHSMSYFLLAGFLAVPVFAFAFFTGAFFALATLASIPWPVMRSEIRADLPLRERR